MRSLLFDFDGTLMDTWPGIQSTLKAALTELEIPFEAHTVTRELVGMPLQKVFEKLMPGDGSGAEAAARKYRELFPRIGMPGARPFEGVPGLLEDLRMEGRQLYLVTARNEIITRRMMAEHGLTRFFAWVRGELEGEAPEGKSHMVAEVLDRFDLDPPGCVMVGDRSYDVDAAVANGIKAVGVTYGYGTAKELQDAGASHLAETVHELKKVLMDGGSL